MNPAPRRKKPHPAAPLTPAATGPIDLTAAFGLTRRECEVMHWVCEGKRDREIAAILGLSARTVQVHVGHIFAKLNVETRTAAANYCHYSSAHPTESGSANRGARPGSPPGGPSKRARSPTEQRHG